MIVGPGRPAPGIGGLIMAAKRKYAWEDWFSRAPTTIRRGDHYAVSQLAMYRMILKNASNRGIRIRVKDTEIGFTIEVTGTRMGENDGEASAGTGGELPVGSDCDGPIPRMAGRPLPASAYQDGVGNSCGG